MSKFNIDYNMGKINEDRVYNIIQKYWDERQISKSSDQYCNYDFYDSKYKYELKSRRCDHNKYPTTMIPEIKCNKRTYLLFLFDDGLYYIRFNKYRFEKYDKKRFVKNRDDKQDVMKYYYYIPVEDLKKIVINKNEINKIDNDKFIVYFE
jgi:hypothetical protein